MMRLPTLLWVLLLLLWGAASMAAGHDPAPCGGHHAVALPDGQPECDLATPSVPGPHDPAFCMALHCAPGVAPGEPASVPFRRPGGAGSWARATPSWPAGREEEPPTAPPRPA